MFGAPKKTTLSQFNLAHGTKTSRLSAVANRPERQNRAVDRT